MSQSENNESVQKQVTVKRMVGAFGGNVASLIAIAAAGFVNTKICLDLLGKADYGLVILVSTIAGWTGLGDLGFGTAVRQRMTVLLARGEVKNAARVLSSGIAFYTIMALLMIASVAGTFLLFGPDTVTSFFVKSDGLDMARTTRLLILGVSLVLMTFPLSPLNGVLLARNDFLAQNLFTIVSSLLRPAVSFIVLKATGSVEAFLVAMSAYTLIVVISKYAYVLRRAPELWARPSFASVDMVKSLVTPSIAFFIISVAFTVVNQTSNVIISAMIGVAAIPAFAAAFQLFSTLRSLCVTSGDVLFPAAGILDSQGQHEKLQKYLEITTRMSMALAVLGGIGLVFLGGPLIGVWLGPSLNPGYGTLLTLGALLPVATLVNMTTRSVCGVGRHHWQAGICVIEMVLNLGTAILLAPRLGLVGVALGTLLARTAVTPLYVVDGVRQLKLSLGRLLGTAVAPNAVLAGVLFAAGTVSAIPHTMRLSVLIVWVVGYSVLCVAILLVLLPADARRRARYWIAAKFLASRTVAGAPAGDN